MKSSDSPKTIDQYISTFPQDVQEVLRSVRDIIREAAPTAEEAIRYQIPTFVLDGNLVHFAAFKKHLGFYPTASGIEHFEESLSAYRYSKGSVQFPLDSAIPLSLIKRIVKFRVKENRERALKKKTAKKSVDSSARVAKRKSDQSS